MNEIAHDEKDDAYQFAEFIVYMEREFKKFNDIRSSYNFFHCSKATYGDKDNVYNLMYDFCKYKSLIRETLKELLSLAVKTEKNSQTEEAKYARKVKKYIKDLRNVKEDIKVSAFNFNCILGHFSDFERSEKYFYIENTKLGILIGKMIAWENAVKELVFRKDLLMKKAKNDDLKELLYARAEIHMLINEHLRIFALYEPSSFKRLSSGDRTIYELDQIFSNFDPDQFCKELLNILKNHNIKTKVTEGQI